MENLSPAYIRRLIAMEEAASPRPWVVFEDGACCGINVPGRTIVHNHSSTGHIGPKTEADYNFIVSIRNAAPQLLASFLAIEAGGDAASPPPPSG